MDEEEERSGDAWVIAGALKPLAGKVFKVNPAMAVSAAAGRAAAAAAAAGEAPLTSEAGGTAAPALAAASARNTCVRARVRVWAGWAQDIARFQTEMDAAWAFRQSSAIAFWDVIRMVGAARSGASRASE